MAEPIRLRKGDEGPRVAEAQTMLTELGFYRGQIDGVFGPETIEAVMAFQEREGLLTDSVIGPATWEALWKAQTAKFTAEDQTPQIKRAAPKKKSRKTAEPSPQAQKVEVPPEEPPTPPTEPTESPETAPPTPSPEYFTTFHSAFPEGMRWRLTPEGVEVEGSGVERMEGEARTVRSLWNTYNDAIMKRAEQYQVPDVLIVATLAAVSRGHAQDGEIDIYRSLSSTSLLGTFVQVGRDLLQDPSIDEKWFLEPDNAIQAGTAYINKIRELTLLDPPRVAAVLSSGEKFHDPGADNRWRMGIPVFMDSFIRYFNDAVFGLRQNPRPESVPYDV